MRMGSTTLPAVANFYQLLSVSINFCPPSPLPPTRSLGNLVDFSVVEGEAAAAAVGFSTTSQSASQKGNLNRLLNLHLGGVCLETTTAGKTQQAHKDPLN